MPLAVFGPRVAFGESRSVGRSRHHDPLSNNSDTPVSKGQATPFYGWYLVGISWLLYGIGVGPAYYSWPFFTPEIMAEIGLTRAEAGTVFGVLGFMITFACPISGAAIARWGIRRTMIAGHLCAATGFWLTSQAESFTDCVIFFSVMVGFGIGAGSVVPCQTIATEWFDRYRGRAVAIILTAGGIIGSAVTWFDSLIVEHFSFRHGWQFFALMELVLVAIAFFLIRNKPSDVGQFPDGNPSDLADDTENEKASGSSPQWTVVSTIKTPQFVVLLLCKVGFLIPWSVTVGHGRLHLEDAGLTTSAAAGVLSVMVFMSVIGRICGGLGDFIKAENVLAWSLILEGLGVLGFLFASGALIAYVSTIVIALGFGASFISLSVVIARYYGKDRFAKTVGMIYLGGGFFNAFAAGIAGRIYDQHGSYNMAFASIAFATIAIGLLALRLRPPKASAI